MRAPRMTTFKPRDRIDHPTDEKALKMFARARAASDAEVERRAIQAVRRYMAEVGHVEAARCLRDDGWRAYL